MISRRAALPTAVAAVALAGCGGREEHVSLSVRAPSALADAPVAITVRGLSPHARVTLRARWNQYGGHAWTSTTALRAGAAGTIRLAGIGGMRFL